MLLLCVGLLVPIGRGRSLFLCRACERVFAYRTHRLHILYALSISMRINLREFIDGHFWIYDQTILRIVFFSFFLLRLCSVAGATRAFASSPIGLVSFVRSF